MDEEFSFGDPLADYSIVIVGSEVKDAIRAVIEDSHASYFLRHEVGGSATDATLEALYSELVAPVLRKLADG